MPEDNLPDEIRGFIREYIHTVEALEILALLRRDATKQWTVSAIFKTILSNEESIARRLNEFSQYGFVKTDIATSSYIYNAENQQLDHLLELTLQAYATRPVTVVEAIFRPERTSLQSFADAFRFKQK